MTKVISIGRNVGKKPMSRYSWFHFKEDLMEMVEPGNTIYFAGKGKGIYGGKTEDSFTVVFRGFVDRAKLSRLARKYQQDSIALTEGETYFVRAYVPASIAEYNVPSNF